MITRRMVMLSGKAVIIFVLCFAVVQLASIKKKADNDLPPPHLRREDGDGDEGAEKKPDVNPDGIKAVEGKDIVKPVIKGEEVQEPDNLNQNKIDSPLKFVDNGGNDHQENVAAVPDKAVEPDRQPDRQPQLQKPDEDKGQDNMVAAADLLKDSQIEEPKHEEQQPLHKDKDEKEDDHENENENEDDDDEEDDDEFPPHKLVNGKSLSLKELQPPDHMDGVRMEQDGHLNKDYKKEIFLGEHEEFEQQSNVNPEKILEQVFAKVDKDKDHFISLAELEEWILAKVKEHFDEANEEASRIFKHLDTEHKGSIGWRDFHTHFLVAKGHDMKEAMKHAEDYETIALDPDDKERLIRYKFRWAEADEEPQDNKLTLEEFKAFRHPEQSKQMIDRMVQDIIENLDQNNDGEVTEEEFVALPPGEVDGQFIESDKAWQEERRKEFRQVIDINHDEKVTRDELKNYVDPQNPNHGRLEAENLLQLADENNDNKLSLEEVLDNSELFLGSKMVDTGRNFHDEF